MQTRERRNRNTSQVENPRVKAEKETGRKKG
jgi:hypothetical protein